MFPRSAHRARRVLLKYRAARASKATPTAQVPTRPVRPWLYIDPALFSFTQFVDAAARAGARTVPIDGLEHLDAARARGKGVILWLGAFGDRARAIVALAARGYPIVQLHGEGHGGSRSWLGQRVVKLMHRRLEARIVHDVITIERDSLGYLRRVIDCLRDNKVVGVPTLGRDGNKFVSLSFQGATRYFPTGMMTLARQTAAALIPTFAALENGEERVVLAPPLPVQSLAKGDRGLVRLASLYVRQLTSYVERYPELWWGWPKPPDRLDERTILPSDDAEPAAP